MASVPVSPSLTGSKSALCPNTSTMNCSSTVGGLIDAAASPGTTPPISDIFFTSTCFRNRPRNSRFGELFRSTMFFASGFLNFCTWITLPFSMFATGLLAKLPREAVAFAEMITPPPVAPADAFLLMFFAVRDARAILDASLVSFFSAAAFCFGLAFSVLAIATFAPAFPAALDTGAPPAAAALDFLDLLFAAAFAFFLSAAMSGSMFANGFTSSCFSPSSSFAAPTTSKAPAARVRSTDTTCLFLQAETASFSWHSLACFRWNSNSPDSKIS
mmetsp:Transcript_17171/g.42651  ORF Transcript_17171/g.42651 Transcript_17171/m.42651 type:complete len:273 (+) Transcript_17171:253-1071(+)